MTVKELIELLKTMPEEFPVQIDCTVEERYPFVKDVWCDGVNVVIDSQG